MKLLYDRFRKAARARNKNHNAGDIGYGPALDRERDKLITEIHAVRAECAALQRYNAILKQRID